ncbi:SCO1664 family protein [Nocardioides sp. Y6]|uniref:SCO1664 family protein n=1 Tax=Nocardioides malaquae TaxID=2773426 RepID=A0ABR9RSC2_9ACTN|nr:SCO1664 family protein [Nocardioides malaquae]
MTLHGRLMSASNATFVGDVDGVRVVYKPVSGERPLWDFPDGTLAERELASFLVSDVLGWDVVPPTVLREGPHGPGMVQLWREPDPDQHPVDLVPAGEVGDDVCHVLNGLDARDRPVTLVHERSAALRRIAVFDVVVNNADRKGGHVLPMRDGHRYGVDHGLTFHTEPKLRTVLWGWAGEALVAPEVTGLEALIHALHGDLGRRLGELLTRVEVAATLSRCEELLAAGTLPGPDGRWPAIPWPPF